MVTESKQHVRRTVPLRVKLSPDIAGRLDAIARPRGLTAATLGALAVGDYVQRYERVIDLENAAANESDKGKAAGGGEGSSAGAEAAA